MNESRVIALRFRPKTFDQVVGQEAIVRTLTNAIKSGTLHHAYLFGGARGVGKTTTARLVARALNCANGPTTQPCGACPSCIDIAESRSMLVTEIDAASNTSVDNVRQVIVNSTTFSPPAGQHRVFIIDEVHQLSGAAFNALLKTIEEPPPRVVFIMATTELQKVPDTILSRCQVFEFRTIPLPKVIAELKRIAGELGINISDSALGTVARAGEGSMRDAESALDQVISFAGASVSDDDVSLALGLPSFETLRAVLEAVADQNPQAILAIVDMIVTRGYDIRNFCREVMTYVRNLLVVKVSGFDPELTQMPQSEAEWIGQLADRFSDQDLLRFFSILSKTEQDIRVSSQPRFQLEIGLVKMAQLARLYLLEEAIDRIAALEGRLRGESGAAPPQAAPPQSHRKTTQGPPAGRVTPGGTQAEKPLNTSQSRTAPVRGPASGTAGPTPAVDAGAARRPVHPREPLESDDGLSRLEPGRPDSGPSSNPPNKVQEAKSLPQSDGKTDAAAGTDTATAIDKVKRVLESRKKMILLMELEKGNISIQGQYLLVNFTPADRHYKAQIEAPEARRIIEEACYEALGTRLTLSASLGGSTSSEHQSSSAGPAQQPAQTAAAPPPAQPGDPSPENHPAVRAVVERFNGEIIDVQVPKP